MSCGDLLFRNLSLGGIDLPRRLAYDTKSSLKPTFLEAPLMLLLEATKPLFCPSPEYCDSTVWLKDRLSLEPCVLQHAVWSLTIGTRRYHDVGDELVWLLVTAECLSESIMIILIAFNYFRASHSTAHRRLLSTVDADACFVAEDVACWASLDTPSSVVTRCLQVVAFGQGWAIGSDRHSLWGIYPRCSSLWSRWSVL